MSDIGGTRSDVDETRSGVDENESDGDTVAVAYIRRDSGVQGFGVSDRIMPNNAFTQLQRLAAKKGFEALLAQVAEYGMVVEEQEASDSDFAPQEEDDDEGEYQEVVADEVDADEVEDLYCP